MEGVYTPDLGYGQSKLANALFSLELARRLEGTTATSNSVRPGVIMTATSFVLMVPYYLMRPLIKPLPGFGGA